MGGVAGHAGVFSTAAGHQPLRPGPPRQAPPQHRPLPPQAIHPATDDHAPAARHSPIRRHHLHSRRQNHHRRRHPRLRLGHQHRLLPPRGEIFPIALGLPAASATPASPAPASGSTPPPTPTSSCSPTPSTPAAHHPSLPSAAVATAAALALGLMQQPNNASVRSCTHCEGSAFVGSTPLNLIPIASPAPPPKPASTSSNPLTSPPSSTRRPRSQRPPPHRPPHQPDRPRQHRPPHHRHPLTDSIATGLELTTLFSPEHGIFGVKDSTNIGNDIDPTTHLPVISLYGPKTRPPPHPRRPQRPRRRRHRPAGRRRPLLHL